MLRRHRFLPWGSCIETRARSLVAVWLASAVLFFAVGCGGDEGDGQATVQSTAANGAPATRSDPSLTGTITVLAAASLTDAFTQLGRMFEAGHPGAKVTFSFGASSTLAAQAIQGAPADLMASADEANLQKVVDAGNASQPKVFARNRLAILVAKGNPKGIKG
jgi:molybdate transport system substrate-binding protein